MTCVQDLSEAMFKVLRGEFATFTVPTLVKVII